MGKNLREQFLAALQAPLKYDAFIINGNEGALLLQLAEELNIALDSFIVSNFYRVSGSRFTRLWHRNGYGMGGEAWKLLMKLLNGGQGECSILPVEQYSTVNDSNSDSEGGFDV